MTRTWVTQAAVRSVRPRRWAAHWAWEGIYKGLMQSGKIVTIGSDGMTGMRSVTGIETRGYLPHTSKNKSIVMTRVFDEDLTAGFGTRAIHAGQRPEPLAGAIMTPVYLTSTYVQEELGRNKGYEYARGKNPTREALERNVAALEGGRHGFAFSSGMGCVGEYHSPGTSPFATGRSSIGQIG